MFQKIGMLCGVLFLTVSVHASVVDDAVQAQLSGQAVYVAKGAPLKVDAGRLTQRIHQGTLPVFLAVLPETDLDAGEIPILIGRQLPVPMAVGVLAGKSFRANASADVGDVSASRIAAAATSAFNARKAEGPTVVLLDWIDRVSPIRVQKSAVAAPSDVSDLRDEVPAKAGTKAPTYDTGIPWGWVLPLSFFVGLIWWVGFKKKKPDAPIRYTNPGAEPDTVITKVGDKSFKRSTQKSTVTPHYCSGGYYQNTYVPAGYYNDPFWNYMMLSMVLDHSRQATLTVPAPVVDAEIPIAAVKPDTVVLPNHSEFASTPAEVHQPSGGGDFGGGGYNSGGGDYSSHDSGGGDHHSYDSGGGGFSSSSGGGDFGGSSSGSGGGDF